MIYKIFAPIAMIFFCACATVKQASPEQGASGYIYLKTGNQMPSPGRPMNNGRGVSRDIYFYKPTTAADLTGNMPLFSAVKTQLVLHVKSDSTGAYTAKLPVGTYSVFVKEEGKFFGAITDGNGVINPVNIAPNTITSFNLTITANAAF